MLSQNSRIEDVSPRRRSGSFSTFSHHDDGSSIGPDSCDPHSHLYLSPGTQNGEIYHNGGHGQPPLGDAQNGRLLSPGEAGGTPALMGSSPLLGSNGLLETAFADLKLDVGANPNGDGPSMLSGIGGGGPPSASDGGGGTEGLASSGVWRADAFGSALGVNLSSSVDDIGGISERKSISGGVVGRGGGGGSEGGLGEHFMGALGTEGGEGPAAEVNRGWR